MVTSLLDRAIYSYADVDRLNGLHSGTARRWLEGYTRTGTFYQPVLREEPTGAESVTWGEMVEARLLAEFRRKDIPIQRLRPAVVRLRAEFGRYPLAQARPWLDTEGRELVRRVQDEVGLDPNLRLVVVRNDQVMLSFPAEQLQASVTRDADRIVNQLKPDARMPEVVMDPQRGFGQPVVRGVRTESLAEDYRAGTAVEDLAKIYELTPNQVNAALRFELAAASRRTA